MPFDPNITPARLNRSMLIDALRNQRHPCWNFHDGRCCALPISRSIDPKFRFGLGILDQIRIFGIFAPLVGYSLFYGKSTRSVTPFDVADALEAAPYR